MRFARRVPRSVFEAFREVCYETYGLDCACYFTASNLSGDAFLKVCNANLKLLTEREHLNIVQKMIRGGMSSIYGAVFLKPKTNTSKTSTLKSPLAIY